VGNSLDELASYFRPLAEQLIAKANSAGLDVVIEDTGRTESEQQVKLAQGVSWTQRSKHLPQPPEGKSEAIDGVPRACMALKYWGWNGTIQNSNPLWGKLIAIARTIPGIKCGVDFPRPDPGHFQYDKSTSYAQADTATFDRTLT
jgi:hypothetical protein